MIRPLLLLDVDGVLALRGLVAVDNVVIHQVVSSAGDTHTIGLRPEHGVWITMLAERFDIVWATGWEFDAPRLLEPLLDIPHFDVLEFSERPSLDRRLQKTVDVTRFAGGRPVAWVDDDLDNEALEWANTREAPTLLIQPDPTIGLDAAQVAKLVDFAAALIARS